MSFKSLIDEIENNLHKILDDLSVSDILFSVEPAKPGFGDVSSNVSFLLAKHLKKNPKEIADILSEKYMTIYKALLYLRWSLILLDILIFLLIGKN